MFLQFAKAWTEPTAAPPTVNIGAPLTTGSGAQTKTGYVNLAGAMQTPYLYDSNDTRYFVDPASSSRMNYGVYDNVYSYGWMEAGIFYDANDTRYYVDPNGASVFNDAYIIDRMTIGGSGLTSGSAYGFGNGAAWPNKNSLAVDTLETDGGVGGTGTLELNYYGGNEVHIGPSGTKAIRAAIMYDGNNGGYYIDPNGNSNILSLHATGNISATGGYVEGYNGGGVDGLLNYQGYGGYFVGSGGVYSQNASGYYTYLDYPGTSWGLLTNGSVYASDFYIASTGKWASTLGANSLTLNTWQGNHYSGSDGAEYAGIFYDANDTRYYIDPNGNSNILSLHATGNISATGGYVEGYNGGGVDGLLNYQGYGGYFVGSGGVYSQNASGYYTYLDYPGTSWGLLTNGSVYASDFYIASTGKWASQLGSHGQSNCSWVPTSVYGDSVVYALCPSGRYLAGLDVGYVYTQGVRNLYCCSF